MCIKCIKWDFWNGEKNYYYLKSNYFTLLFSVYKLRVLLIFCKYSL